ncbi:hypothetical protein B0H13DRAFT_1862206 [Mycena leptocephala]|nr:hypothetical protein B0H13DRAFT_1862206 [Mycena leptocephala]
MSAFLPGPLPQCAAMVAQFSVCIESEHDARLCMLFCPLPMYIDARECELIPLQVTTAPGVRRDQTLAFGLPGQFGESQWLIPSIFATLRISLKGLTSHATFTPTIAPFSENTPSAPAVEGTTYAVPMKTRTCSLHQSEPASAVVGLASADTVLHASEVGDPGTREMTTKGGVVPEEMLKLGMLYVECAVVGVRDRVPAELSDCSIGGMNLWALWHYTALSTTVKFDPVFLMGLRVLA